MSQHAPNGYAPPMSESDRRAAQSFFGVNPPRMGPPAPTQGMNIQDAQAGNPDAFKRLLSGVATNPDGSLQSPDPASHHRRPADPKRDQAWLALKMGIAADKTVKGKLPPKGKLPKEVPTDPNKVLEVAAEANMPSDNAAMKELKGLIDKYENGKKRLDWSPVIALVDDWTGSNLLRSYDKPLSDEEREKIVLQLRGKLAAQEEDLQYKRDYMASQRAEAKERREDKASAAEKDRDLKRYLGVLASNSKADVSASREEQALMRQKRNYLKDNKNALGSIAKSRYGIKNDEDKSYELHVGALNDEVFALGRDAEEAGMAKPGEGYQQALQFYLQNPLGPDGGR